MEVEARILHWTASGMRTAGGIGDYVEVRELERLLEEAHQRGFEAGQQNEREKLK